MLTPAFCPDEGAEGRHRTRAPGRRRLKDEEARGAGRSICVSDDYTRPPSVPSPPHPFTIKAALSDCPVWRKPSELSILRTPAWRDRFPALETPPLFLEEAFSLLAPSAFFFI